MNTLDKYNDFIKRINEDVGDNTDPFINVKGNFAGAENTLVGSAIINIFTFMKRKINEGVLWLYKNALQREYLADLIRYCYKNGIKIKNPDEYFSVTKIKDAQDNFIEESNIISVRFDNGDKSVVNNYVKGSKVVGKDGKLVEDGTYKKDDDSTAFVVHKGKIIQIYNVTVKSDVSSSTTSPKKVSDQSSTGEGGTTPQSTTADIPSPKTGDSSGGAEIKPDKDIQDYVNDTIRSLKNRGINTSNEKDFLYKKLKQINDIIKVMDDGGIKEIERLMKSKNISDDKKAEMKIDKKVYEENEKLLNGLADIIKTKISSYEKNIKLKKAKKESTVSESLSIEDEIILEEFRGVDIGYGVDHKMGDELTSWKSRFVGFKDLKYDDRRLSKYFESKEKKRELTDLMIENKSPLIKIQLSAERIFGDADTPAKKKLKNTWDKMVESAKGMYSRFVFVDEVDPRVLKKQLDEGLLKQYNSEIVKDSESIYNKGKDLRIKANIETNKNLGLTKREFNKVDEISTGILSLLSGNFVYIQDYSIIQGNKHYAYKLMGKVDLESLSADKESDSLTKYIEYNKLVEKFVPREQKKTFTNKQGQSVNLTFQVAIIVNNTPNKHLVRTSEFGIYTKNKALVLYLYTSKLIDEMGELKPEELNVTYGFGIAHARQKGVVIDVTATPKTSTSKNLIEDYLFDISLNNPFPIPSEYEDKYGIKDEWKKLSFVPVVDQFKFLKALLYPTTKTNKEKK